MRFSTMHWMIAVAVIAIGLGVIVQPFVLIAPFVVLISWLLVVCPVLGSVEWIEAIRQSRRKVSAGQIALVAATTTALSWGVLALIWLLFSFLSRP